MKTLKKINKDFKKIEKDLKLTIKKGKIPPKLIRKKGTPPGEMSPFDPEWWEICRDEEAPGIPHEGIYGCYECFTMCTSHPEATDPQDVFTCGQLAVTDCILPEIQEQIEKLLGYLFPTNTCDPWTQTDSDTWESTTCEDPMACANECVRFCPTQGFDTGTCQTAGEIYYCNCEDT